VVVPDPKPDMPDQLRQGILRRPSHLDGAPVASTVDQLADWRMEKKQHMPHRRGAQMLLHGRCALLNGELGKYARWSAAESSQVLAVAS
jgi:hypothetical protein